MKITVWYSPQPYERFEVSAALEYANRISDLLTQDYDERKNLDNDISIHQLSIDSLKFINEYADESQHTFIILSCSADGSVDRIVRKLLRSMNSETPKTEEIGCQSEIVQSACTTVIGRISIALLGHARCENSAQQMSETIFNNGRKFHQRLLLELNAPQRESEKKYWRIEDRLEVQVELESPDDRDGFDDWVTKKFIAN